MSTLISVLAIIVILVIAYVIYIMFFEKAPNPPADTGSDDSVPKDKDN